MASTILELDRENFFPRLWASELLSITRLSPTSFRFAEFLWSNIGTGAPEDRSGWNSGQWHSHLGNPANHVYAVFNDTEPVGCFEIIREEGDTTAGRVQITGFGLLPEFTNESLGPPLLTRVIEKAFALGAAEIFIDTEEEFAPALRRACEQQGFQSILSG